MTAATDTVATATTKDEDGERAAPLRPVWLLDVDGVVNAATRNPDPSVWPRDQWAALRVHKLPILVARPVVDFIAAVHEAGTAEIRWHTTWQDGAHELADAIGLPTFPIADAPEYRTWDLDRAAGWWKRPAAERVLTVEGRPLVWTDDDITWSLGRRGQDEMRALGPALLVGPNERTGLTPKHLRWIGDFLAIHAPEPTTITIERSS